MIDKKKMFLLNGQIISTKKDGSENNIIKFEQLDIDLSNLTTSNNKKTKNYKKHRHLNFWIVLLSKIIN